MKVALIHDWLTGMRGGERVLQQFLALYPGAKIFTLLHIPGSTTPEIDSAVQQSSWISRLPYAHLIYRHLLPIYPIAVRNLDLSGYDLVISLSHAAAKNVVVPKGAVHLSYCFTPMRYIWDQHKEYFGSLTKILFPIFLYLRTWDVRGANRVHAFAAISNFIRARIRCFYNKNAEVIFPPVDTSWIKPIQSWTQGEAFLYAGALVPYKKPDVVIEAFNKLGLPLWVVGNGPMLEELQAKAARNIQFLGKLPDDELSDRYRRCRALIFPGVEDFGMIPIECLAAGRPVIGMYKGGTKETLTARKHWINQESSNASRYTGVFIKPGRVNLTDSLISSVRYFIKTEQDYTPSACIERATQFSPEVFRTSWEQFAGRYI